MNQSVAYRFSRLMWISLVIIYCTLTMGNIDTGDITFASSSISPSVLKLFRHQQYKQATNVNAEVSSVDDRRIQSNDVINQFTPLAPGFGDDDYRIDFNQSSSGFVYFQYYSEATCGGSLTSYNGIRTSICYTFNDTSPESGTGSGTNFQSYQIRLFNDTDCATHSTIFYYTDTACQIELKHEDLSPYLSSSSSTTKTCVNMDVIDDGNNIFTATTFEASYEMMCVYGDSVPVIEIPSVLTEYYFGDSSCSDSGLLVEFTGMATDLCLLLSSDGGDTSVVNLSCGTDDESASLSFYNSTKTCVQNIDVTETSTSSFECALTDDITSVPYDNSEEMAKNRRLSLTSSTHKVIHALNSSTNATESPSLMPTSHPSLSPSTLVIYGKSSCFNQPTLTPTETPTTPPTYEPSAEPSFSLSPTFPPSLAPSMPPTLSPTVSLAPTIIQTVSPSWSQSPTWSQNPSASPTESPTLSPTLAPSLSPTLLPTTTSLPTNAPTYGTSFAKFSATQVLNGISLTTYNQEKTSNEFAIKKSITACMTGVSVDDIVSFQVTTANSVSPSDRQRALSPSLSATSDAIALTYTIQAEFPGASYISLSNQLQANIANGVFDTYLATYSQAIGASDLSGCTSSSVTTLEITSSSSNDDNVWSAITSSLPVLIGVCVGGGVFVCLLIIASIWCYRRRRNGSQEQNDYLGESDSLSSHARSSGSLNHHHNKSNKDKGKKPKFMELRSYDKYLQQEDEENVTFGLAHHMAI